MSVRLKIALTMLCTGLLTAAGVIAAVVFAFQRFEHESTWHRADAFLGRVDAMYGSGLYEMYRREPAEFNQLLRNLVLLEPDTQLYLLDPQGTVLSSTGSARLAADFKVALAPVREAAQGGTMPYVMGDDPERMDADAIITARALRPRAIGADAAVVAYLYQVSHSPVLPEGRTEVLGRTFAVPGLLAIVGVLLLSMLHTGWVVSTVTRPLHELTRAVAQFSRHGLQGGGDGVAPEPSSADVGALTPGTLRRADEFGQLARVFDTMQATVRRQWAALRRLDHFRREGVSNLSHDLRSPLTATVAGLETLEARWAGEPARAGDLELLRVALRNTRNAARLVQSLGDLAQLDEPAFKLRAEVQDVSELLDDIALRFGARAAERGVRLVSDAAADGEAAHAALDIELFERAVANLVDNALKFCRSGDAVRLSARRAGDAIEVRVQDSGPGIPAADLPQLFDRFYQARSSVAPATGEGGKGLGLAIVKRIAELHGGTVGVRSLPGDTEVLLRLPAAPGA